MIEYRGDAEGIDARQLAGFFEGWPRVPSPDQHVATLRASYAVELALDGERVVGFATAISDGVFAAAVPLVEVLREYRGRGIGGELVNRLLGRLEGLYMVDLTCEEELVPFYERFGFERLVAMSRRDPGALRG